MKVNFIPTRSAIIKIIILIFLHFYSESFHHYMMIIVSINSIFSCFELMQGEEANKLAIINQKKVPTEIPEGVYNLHSPTQD